MNLKTGYVDSGNIKLYIEYSEREVEVEQGKDTILFLHGYPDFLGTWSHQMDHFKANYHVAAFDMRGCHKSDAPAGPEGFQVANILPDVTAVINFLTGNDGQVILVGHDWGGDDRLELCERPAFGPKNQSLYGHQLPPSRHRLGDHEGKVF